MDAPRPWSDERTAALRARLAARTPGPWGWHSGNHDTGSWWTEANLVGMPRPTGCDRVVGFAEANAALLGHAADDLRDLLAAYEALVAASSTTPNSGA